MQKWYVVPKIPQEPAQLLLFELPTKESKWPKSDERKGVSDGQDESGGVDYES